MFSGGRKPNRLENWDGRRRSSRADPAVLHHIWRKPVALRLALALLTALGITALLHLNGPAFPHRVGETSPYDFRARVGFELPNEHDTSERAEGEPIRNPHPAAVSLFAEGTLLIKQGQTITAAKHDLLRAEHRAYQASLSIADHAARMF